jgi:hypothetical protein
VYAAEEIGRKRERENVWMPNLTNPWTGEAAFLLRDTHALSS